VVKYLGVTTMLVVGGLAVGGLAAQATPSGFSPPEPVYSGVDYPTNLEFAPNGRVYVTEKGGQIWTAASVGQPLTEFANLSGVVHDFWDRGLLGLAVHPNFPTERSVYVLYAYGTPLPIAGGPTQSYGDNCPDPPGDTDDGCVVSARLSRLTTNAAGTQMTGEQVLINDWCQQYPSHSIGDLQFGADGALYVSGGDGASFNFVDYGQGPGGGHPPGSPTPRNPCGDPPSAPGGSMTAPGAQGGALRSQDLETSGDPVTLDGAILRLDPMTGAALPSNPNFSHPDPNGRRIVAYGLRNPYRFTFRPGTNDLYIGDVGWSTWEEVNRHPNPSAEVRNFGWPCYEGGDGTSAQQSGYNNANLTVCEDLYSGDGVTSPTGSLFAYRHNEEIQGGDPCPPAGPGPFTATSSSTTGLAFYSGGAYPGEYYGALFGADYSRNCIWVMYPGANGVPDPNTVEVFHYEPDAGEEPGIRPVDLEMGPDGNMYYVSFLQGVVGRFEYTAGNTPPIADIDASATSGAAPLTVDFDATGSSDPDGHPIVEYLWDFDNDGQFDDGSGAQVQRTFQPGTHIVRLRVRDFPGATDTHQVTINASNSAPTATMTTPTVGTQWSVGQVIGFSGSGTDPEEGALPASRLTWNLIMHHCEDDGSCHQHPLQTFNGVASGSFTAPDHPHPSHLELRLTVRDQFGVTNTVSRQLNSRTVALTFRTNPVGLEVTVEGEDHPTPHTETFIVGSSVDVTAASPQESPPGSFWGFGSWSHGQPRTHTIVAPSSATTYTASFAQVLGSSPTSGLFFVRDDGLFRAYDPAPNGSLGSPVISGNDWPEADGWMYSSISIAGQGGAGFDTVAYDTGGPLYVQPDPVDYYLSGHDPSTKELLVDEPGWDVVRGIQLGCCGGTVLFYEDDGTFRWSPVGLSGGDPVLSPPVQSGNGYTPGWTAIVPIDLDGDGIDEVLFYRSSDGLFRYYDVRANGSIGSPLAAGNGYTTGWDSMTAVDLDGDGQDEIMFYRASDGIFRYYNIGPTGKLPKPLLSGTYTTGWDSITAFGD
jgi:glucose/arabinose dehydrogenase